MSNLNKGTPSTLAECAKHCEDAKVSGPIAHVVRDYLAQKFAVVRMLHPECDDMVKELWKSLTQEELK